MDQYDQLQEAEIQAIHQKLYWIDRTHFISMITLILIIVVLIYYHIRLVKRAQKLQKKYEESHLLLKEIGEKFEEVKGYFARTLKELDEENQNLWEFIIDALKFTKKQSPEIGKKLDDMLHERREKFQFRAHAKKKAKPKPKSKKK